MKKMMTILLGPAIVALLSVVGSSCATYSVSTSENVLSKRAIDCLQDSGNYCITSRLLNTDFWEELWILSPYVDVGRFGKMFPLKVKRAIKQTGIEYREDICVFVFVLNNDDYQIYIEERCPVDFVSCSPDSLMKCTPDALMCFTESGDLRTRFILNAVIQGCATGKSG